MMSVGDLFYGGRDTNHQPHYMMSAIELKVPMCCSKCEDKVRKALLDTEGVYEVTTDQVKQKVTIVGNMVPEIVLNRVRRIKKRSDYWNRSSSYHKWSSHSHGDHSAVYSPSQNESYYGQYNPPYMESSFDRTSYSQSAFGPAYIETTYSEQTPSYNQFYDPY